MKIGIFGGTFNPPHLGHLAAAQAAAAALELDRLLIVPASIPPHKELPENTPSPEHRLAMAEIMADALLMPQVTEVSSLELDRAGKSYTADTLAALREEYPEAELWLLMGTDMFLTLQYWREPEKILELAGVCAFGRTEQDGEEVFAPQREYLQKTCPGARLTTITLPGLVDISSTRLRELLAKGKGGDYLIPAVYGYILRNQLYGTRADLKHLDIPELRACSYSMVMQKRVRHIRGTEEEAVRLARRWGADETHARRAGILHDCTKYLELEEQLALCERYGVELDELEHQAVKLLHSKTGACIARHVFGEPDEVFDAIFWHTTAKENMTTLEKILYVADYMEPNRTFEGVERLRELAYRDLDAALLLGVETTIQEMKDRNLPVHQSTLRAQAWLREHGVTTEG
ncbi:nicotinate (nicotinamide) nucleotide adenylyltransferase [Colidextribacter sp. OB.20]|uniref:nicotinate (nicotinamide) nucleotide adenylyltransferase n=1 Tax=Colidextribacter sp. OB.20 TaxID=2304568 RepID=UPI00136B6552|nr:nicotinate (nicotinamide) nucleotide adenylyltransferase [Colidextribacter sp. OB.20]NBI09656.1 nicotinate (nicotinamide) nucleotide adenylyltransferase [Colidextribacter sp. OB.20]